MSDLNLAKAKSLFEQIKKRIAEEKEKEKENSPNPNPNNVINPEADQSIENMLKDFIGLMTDPATVQKINKRNGNFDVESAGVPGGNKIVLGNVDPNSDTFDPTNSFDPNAKVYSLSRKHLERYHTLNEVEALEAFKTLQDAAFFAGHVRAFRNREPVNVAIRKTNAYKQLQSRLQNDKVLQKALATTTAGAGAEWIPTGFSSQLIERINLELRVASQFQSILMPTNPYRFPVDGSDVEGYLIPESTSDNASKIDAVTPTTGNFTFQAKKLAARHLFSEEINEDSVISMIDFVRNKLGSALARALENAILNGDDSGTHMDADVTSAKDSRKAFKGLRYFALNNAGNATLTFSGGAPTAQLLNSLRGLMGKHGVFPSNLFYTVSPASYYRILALDEVLKKINFGDDATIGAGEIGRIYNVPIIVSEFVRTNLHTTGANVTAQSNDKTVIHLVDKRGFWLGYRGMVSINSYRDIETDQMIVVAKNRVDFKDVYDATKAENIQSVLGVDVLV